MYRIAIGCDPNAAQEKRRLIAALCDKGYEITDFGSEDPIYAHVAHDVAKAVADLVYDCGILICGTGIGMTVSANKVKGAYAALISDMYSAQRARKSNDANIACFGAFTIGIKRMEMYALEFLACEFEPGCASQPKVDAFHEVETSYFK